MPATIVLCRYVSVTHRYNCLVQVHLPSKLVIAVAVSYKYLVLFTNYI